MVMGPMPEAMPATTTTTTAMAIETMAICRGIICQGGWVVITSFHGLFLIP